MEPITIPSTIKVESNKRNGVIQVYLKSLSKQKRKLLREKYFEYYTKGPKDYSRCCVIVTKPNSKEEKCGMEYSNPSSSTELEHLATHVGLPEFKDTEHISQTTIDSWTKPKDEIPSFKTTSLLFLLECNISWNSFNSEWWKILVTKYCNEEGFATETAKKHMKTINKDQITPKLMSVISYVPFLSISEDEGTVRKDTKVLHNLHCFDPRDWVYKSFFLRYFDTVSKESVVLCGHWKDSMNQFKITKSKISSFVSDMALKYVPKDMLLLHIPCGVHMLDLCLEDNYESTIKEEVEKFTKVRQFITATSAVENDYTECQKRLHEDESPWPITSLVRFVTHEQAFEHVTKYCEACNEVVQRHRKEDLIIKDSELEAAKGCNLIFKVVRGAMLSLQCGMCCMYLVIMFGLTKSLEKLKILHPNVFSDRTGQELFRIGVIKSIHERIGGISTILGEAEKQLKEPQRSFLVKSMIMEPYLKGKIDVKQEGGESKIFPTWMRQRFVEQCKKELIHELDVIIKQQKKELELENLTTLGGHSEEEEEHPKKKKKLDSFFQDFTEYLEDDIPKVKEHEEAVWFKNKFLHNDLGVTSRESSDVFWKERKIKYPCIIRLLCKYRSVACSSIYEEQCFSTINKIVTDDRTCFKDETVESMMFLKKNHKHFKIE